MRKVFKSMSHFIQWLRLWLRLYQTIRNLTSGDMRISTRLDSTMIRLGVIGFKKTRVMYLLNLFEGRGEIEQCDLACMEVL